jgi:uncharacterized protein YoxC
LHKRVSHLDAAVAFKVLVAVLNEVLQLINSLVVHIDRVASTLETLFRVVSATDRAS